MFKQKLLISSCLLGNNVRYDGTNNCLDNKSLNRLRDKYELLSLCPEVEGGLPTPRIPCEITSQNPLKIINKLGVDKSKNFINGAYKTLELCKKENIKLALLKVNSPSCSNKFIYDGTFNSKKIDGFGVTAKLLLDNNIEVFNENEIEKLI